MHVDRARFFALTLTIAAGGCGVQPSRGAGGRSGPVATPVAIPPASGDSIQGTEEPDDGGVEQGHAPGDYDAALRSAPALPEDYAHLPPRQQELMRLLLQLERSNTGCGPERPPHPPPPPGWMAEEPPPRPLVGYAKQCVRIKGPAQIPGPHCEYWSLDCEEAVSALKPAAGRRTLSCLKRKSGTRGICGYNVVTHCVIGAARAAASDRRTEAACERILRSCRGKAVAQRATPLTRKDCNGYLSSVDCPGAVAAGLCLSETCALEPCINPLW